MSSTVEPMDLITSPAAADTTAAAMDVTAADEHEEPMPVTTTTTTEQKSATADEEGESESKEETKKPATPKKPRQKAESKPSTTASSTAAASVSAGVSSRGRERKATNVFVPPSPIHKLEEEFVIEAGEGTELGEIENVKRRLDMTNAQDEQCGGTKKVIKKHIRAFSGYVKPDVEAHAELAKERLDRYDLSCLKLVAQICDISESGPKSKLIENIVDFLKKPHSSGGAFKMSSAGGKRKKSTSSKKSKGEKGDKPKRGPNSFMLFSNENRDRVVKKFPDLIAKEIAKKLGEEWNALSDKEKQRWKDRAAGGDEGSSSESESESEEEEEQPKKKAKKEAAPAKKGLSSEWTEKFRSSIAKLLDGADLSNVTMGNIKEELSKLHGELVVEANKDEVKQLVVEMIQNRTSQ